MHIQADDERDAPGGDDDVVIVTGAAGGEKDDAEPKGDDEDQGGDDQDQGGDDDHSGDGGDDEEDIILLGDEAAPASDDDEGAAQWVKDLRKRARDLERENRDLRAGKTVTAAEPTLRAKPTLADHEFDEEAFASDLEAWTGEKAAVDAAQAKAAEQQQAAQATWQARLNDYGTKKAALKVADFDDAEAEVSTRLGKAQQAIIVGYASNPAVVTYALGKRPEKLAELAKIEDPIAFAIEVAKLEGNLKVQRRNGPKPGPESRVAGGAPTTNGDWQKQLDKLEKQADETGDRTAVSRFRKQLREQGKLK